MGTKVLCQLENLRISSSMVHWSPLPSLSFWNTYLLYTSPENVFVRKYSTGTYLLTYRLTHECWVGTGTAVPLLFVGTVWYIQLISGLRCFLIGLVWDHFWVIKKKAVDVPWRISSSAVRISANFSLSAVRFTNSISWTWRKTDKNVIIRTREITKKFYEVLMKQSAVKKKNCQIAR